MMKPWRTLMILLKNLILNHDFNLTLWKCKTDRNISIRCIYTSSHTRTICSFWWRTYINIRVWMWCAYINSNLTWLPVGSIGILSNRKNDEWSRIWKLSTNLIWHNSSWYFKCTRENVPGRMAVKYWGSRLTVCSCRHNQTEGRSVPCTHVGLCSLTCTFPACLVGSGNTFIMNTFSKVRGYYLSLFLYLKDVEKYFSLLRYMVSTPPTPTHLCVNEEREPPKPSILTPCEQRGVWCPHFSKGFVLHPALRFPRPAPRMSCLSREHVHGSRLSAWTQTNFLGKKTVFCVSLLM